MKKSFIITIILTCIIIFISVIYNVFPRLQVNGQKNMTISYRDKYIESGVIVKNAKGNYMSKIKIESNLEENKIGTYYVDYSLNIKGKTLKVRRNIKVIDDISPIIKLKGEQIIELSINEKYIEQGYKATDEYDGDLTERVTITGNIDTSKYGEYVITYEVTDNSHNTTKVNRIIKIIDEEKPKIQCESNYSAHKIGETSLVGCKAIDNYDGDITEKIQINGNYDINVPGIYKVTYTVKDDAGNETNIDHNIVIYDNPKNKKSYLTFDDGPSNLTEEILAILNNFNIKATFFVAEQNNKENYKYLNNIIENGHEIGLHGYHYTEELYSTKENFIKHYEEFKQLIKNQTNQDINIYRFPGGSKSKYLDENVFKQIKKYLNESNIIYYDWNIDSTDSSNLTITSQEIITNTIEQILKNQEEDLTLLFHDTNTKKNSIEALPTIITILKQMGYEFDIISNSTPKQFR